MVMVSNVLMVVIGFLIVPVLDINDIALHRWAPFRLPQFLIGICAGLLAQRGAVTGPVQGVRRGR